MSIPAQVIFPGVLKARYERELGKLAAGNAIRRLWARDTSLWPSEEAQRKSVAANLGWLDLPDHIGPQMTRAAGFADAAEADGFQSVVFVAIGDSNLAAEAVFRSAAKKRFGDTIVLDSTDPGTIASVARERDLRHTLFIFANKSGKHIETHALLLYFLERLRGTGISAPGRNFIAVTEEGSYLAQIARQYNFRECILDPVGIRGRYSSLIHFGLLLAALSRFDPNDLLARVTEMRDACAASAEREKNPAVALAAFLAAGAMDSEDRLVLRTSRSLEALSHRIAQLIGVSMNKRGRGIIPIGDDLSFDLGACQRNCLAAMVTMRGEEDPAVKQTAERMQHAGVPFVSIDLTGPEDFGPEMFKWEIAIALACSLLEVNPFSEPDVQDSRENTAEILERLLKKQEFPSKTVRVREAGIELYAEGGTRQEISTLSLSEALRTFFNLRDPEGYAAILGFVERSAQVESSFHGLREQLAAKLGIPVLLSFGPRYLHSFAQVYKGGPSKGLFLIVTYGPSADVEIPGAGYTFGQLQQALAIGDFESLEQRHKPVIRLHLTQGLEEGSTHLEQAVQRALSSIRGANS